MMSGADAGRGPSVWAVSDGRVGNAAQVRALVSVLSDTRAWNQLGHISGVGHRAGPVVLTPRPPWTWLSRPPWPLPRLALPRAQRKALSAPWPALWIAAGRRSAPYSVAVRRWSRGRTLTVHILDPKNDPGLYDLLIVPEHDTCRGTNILTTTGALTHFSPDAMAAARKAFPALVKVGGRRVMVGLGGHSKAHRFTRVIADGLMARLEALNAQGWHLQITASRRTPASIVAAFRTFAARSSSAFWAGPEDGPNPYLAWLLHADAAIVTADSANMLADVAWHGLPLHIARMCTKHHAPKFDRLHASLVARGVARWFEDDLAFWRYTPIRDADRAADLIVDRLLARYPRPDRMAGGGDDVQPCD